MFRFHHIEVMRCHCPAVVIHDKSRDYSYDRFQYPPSHTTFSGRDQVAIWTPKPRNQTVKLSSSWSKNLVVIVNFQNDCKVLEYLKFHKDARTDMSHMMRSVNMSGAGVTPSWILQFLLYTCLKYWSSAPSSGSLLVTECCCLKSIKFSVLIISHVYRLFILFVILSLVVPHSDYSFSHCKIGCQYDFQNKVFRSQ